MPAAERLFEQRKLRPQIRVNPFAGFVIGPQFIAERLDHLIGRHTDVRRATLNQTQQRREYASHRGHLTTIAIARRGKRVIVPEQFVSAIDQVYVRQLNQARPLRVCIFTRPHAGHFHFRFL